MPRGGWEKKKNPDVVLSFMFRVHSEKSIWSLCFLFKNSNASHFKAYHLLSYCLSQRHKVRREFVREELNFLKKYTGNGYEKDLWVPPGIDDVNNPAQPDVSRFYHRFILLTSTAWILHQMNLEKHHIFFVPTASSNHKDVLKTSKW